jgi:hypothetical protein
LASLFQPVADGPAIEHQVARSDLPSPFARGSGGTGVLNRGDRREPIFLDDVDRERFLESVGEPKGRPR